MRCKLKEKYLINKDDLVYLKPVFKKTIAVLLLVVVIKVVRIYIQSDKNNEVNTLFQELLTMMSIETLVKNGIYLMVFFTLTTFLTFYVVLGKKVLKNYWIVSSLLITTVNGVFIYNYPEIAVSVIEAVFLKS